MKRMIPICQSDIENNSAEHFENDKLMYSLNCEVLEAREIFIDAANSAAKQLARAAGMSANGIPINRLGVLHRMPNVDRLAALISAATDVELLTAHHLNYARPSVEREWAPELKREHTRI